MHKNRWRFSSVGRPQFGVNTDKSRDQAEVKPILNSVLFPVNILSSSNQLETKYPNKFSFNDMLIFTQNFHILSKPGRFHLNTVNLQNSPRQYGAKNFGYTEDNIWHFPAGPIQPNSQGLYSEVYGSLTNQQMRFFLQIVPPTNYHVVGPCPLLSGVTPGILLSVKKINRFKKETYVTVENIGILN